MPLNAQIQLLDQDIRSTSTARGGETLGQAAVTPDGRSFIYGFNNTGSGTALSPGLLNSGAVTVTNHTNRTGAVYAAGTQTVTFAVGATLVSSNQYAGGYLVVNAGTGAGQALLISGNTSAVSSGSPTVNLQDAIITATDATSKFTLIPNLYSACLLFASGSSTVLVSAGVANVSVPDQAYGWFQTGGTCSVLANGTPGIGVNVVPSATTAGAVDVNTASLFQQTVGVMLMTAVSTEYRPCFLTISNS